MATVREIVFTRLSDGTLLQRHPDGTYRPMVPRSDAAKLAALTEAEIEGMATTDPDHPALDDAFWEEAAAPVKEAVSLELDSDVLRYFRQDERDYQARINAVLRRHMRANARTG